MEVTTNSANQTKEFGKKFSKSLKPRDVVCLFGDLGTGKTTFVQGLAVGLGIKKRILSPSFLFVRQYAISAAAKGGSDISEERHCDKVARRRPADKSDKQSLSSLRSGKRFATLYHVDLFRIESPEKGIGLGLAEIFQNKNNVVIIEWAEKLGKFLPPRRIEIYFDYGKKENQRKIWLKRRD